MKRIFVLATAVLSAACQSGQDRAGVSSRRNDTGASTRRLSKGPPVASPEAGRFYARSAGGDTGELLLRKFSVQVSTQPGTVRSHLVMEVAASVDQQMEAVMRLPVPRGAAVTDAVLWVNGKPMRGAFVERQRAADIYTSIVTTRRDPALVTWDGPGWVAVSIFPLEHKQSRRFELDWVEPAAVADGRVQYRVPVVSERDQVIGRAALEVDGHRMTADGRDLIAIAPADTRPVVARRLPGDPFEQVLVRGEKAGDAAHFVLVVETSVAMGATDRVRQRAAIDAILDELPPQSKATILAADWNASVIAEDVDAAQWPAALAKIDAIVSAGTLHLERALREAIGHARRTKADAVLFVGRGYDGFGRDALPGAPASELRDAGVRLSVIDVGTGATPPQLADLAAGSGGEVVVARSFPESLPYVADALHPRRDLSGGRKAGEWLPLRTVAGELVWIGRAIGAIPPAEAEANAIRADSTSALAVDLASLWTRARMEWRNREAADDIAQVLTPVTSLLVLETERDYQRFGLQVPEPAVIEHAAGGRHPGEEGKMGKRTSAAREGLYGLRGPTDNPDPQLARTLAEEQARNASLLGLLSGQQIGEASGVGGLGLVGTGTGGGGTGQGTLGLGTLGTIGKGGGTGYGRNASGRRAETADVIPGQATVRGSLDKEIIRRIIRRHINEVRYCYQQELRKSPGLGGRVLVQFTIATSGQVASSLLQSSTLANPRAENCIVRAVRRWEFPRPHGDTVVVSYPFVLTPTAEPQEARMAGEAPAAPTPVDEALALLADGPTVVRIEWIAARLGHHGVSDPVVLAWTIRRRSAGLQTQLLVARLLDGAQRRRDAVRVLSEAARDQPDAIAGELRRMGADADAAEVLALKQR